MFDLSGRRALVTGASGGIGAAIARGLHAQGCTVVLAGRRREALDELAAALGERCAVETGDIADAAAADAPGRRGRPGRHPGQQCRHHARHAGPAHEGCRLAGSADTNLGAAFRLARAALRGMVKRRWGRIVSITSIVGVTGNPGQANYAAAKAGLIGMSKALAQEVAARGVTVNCVAPGFIDTAMTRVLDEKQREALLGRIPAGRLGEGPTSRPRWSIWRARRPAT